MEGGMRGLAIFFATLILSGAALGQTMAERQACQSDFSKYCPGVKPGGGRVIACLAKQKDKLSPACQKVIEAHSR
jgi:Cysteine rich repeat